VRTQVLLHDPQEHAQSSALEIGIAVQEVAQALGHRQHPLPHRQSRQHVISEMCHRLDQAPGILLEAPPQEKTMEADRTSVTGVFAETRRHWSLMTVYERFEQIVALTLTLVIIVVIVVALVQLVIGVMPLLIGGALNPLEHQTFQALFGMIMTLLIAMEFKHSIIRVALRRESIIQVKTVILIALLALSRKFIILDTATTDAATIAAVAGATFVLGIVYWLLRERDDRSRVTPPRDDSTSA
jgi:uncharacterized membrane protein (DUF373 family)